MASVAGRYESWFLERARRRARALAARALDPAHDASRGRGRRAGLRARSGARSSTRRAGAPAAVKQSLPALPDGRAPRRSGFRGEARARGRMARVGPLADRRRHRRCATCGPAALYRLPLPRTKLEAPVPDGIASGRLVLDGALRRRRRLARDRRPQLGRRARRALGLAARRRLRGRARGVARARDRPRPRRRRAEPLDRQRRRLVRRPALPARRARPRARACAWSPRPAASRRSSRASGSTIHVAVHADLDQTVGFKYAGVGADPVRGEREVLHAGLAEVHLGHPPPGPQLGRAGHRRRRRLRARRAAVGTACRCSRIRTPERCALRACSFWFTPCEPKRNTPKESADRGQETRKERRLPSAFEKRASRKPLAVMARE